MPLYAYCVYLIKATLFLRVPQDCVCLLAAIESESSKVKDIKPRSAAASGIESKIEVKSNRD